MVSEIITVGKSFFKLQRCWMLSFFFVEVLILIAATILLPVYSRHWFHEYSQMRAVWFFVIPPFILQVFLALHLGLFFNLKAPEAWFVRLPFSRSANHFLVYGLLSVNALVLLGALWKAWELFYEMVAYPIAFALIFIPSLTFQAVQRIRKPISSIAVGILSSLVLTSISVAGLMLLHNGVEIPDYSPLQVNGFFLLLTLLIVFGMDSQRKAFLKAASVLVVTAALFFAISAYQRSLVLRSPGYLQINELVKSAEILKPKWDLFKKQTTQIIEAVSEDPNDQYGAPFKERAQALQAMEILGGYSGAHYTQAEMKQIYSNFQTQPGIRTSFSTFMKMQYFPIIAYYNLLSRLIPSVQKCSNLLPSERQKMAQKIWESVSKQMRNSDTLTHALVSMVLIRKLVDYQVIDGVPLEKLDAFQSRMKGIKKNISDSLRPWDSISTPTDQRLKKMAQDMYEREVIPSLQAVDEMMKLIAAAKVVKFR